MSQRKSNAVDTIAVVALLLFLAVACFGGFAFWQYSRVRSVQAEMLRLEAMKAHEQALLQARFAMEEAVKKAADDAGGAVEQAEKVEVEAEQEFASEHSEQDRHDYGHTAKQPQLI